MFGIGIAALVGIFVIGLLVLGRKRAPERAPSLSERVAEFRRASNVPPTPPEAEFELAASAETAETEDALLCFGERLPERFNDPAFRDRFTAALREDVTQLQGLIGPLDQLAALDAPQPEKVNLAALLETLLDQRRDVVLRRHLLVLKELAPDRSMALADPDHLRFAFQALIDKVLERLPEHGDLYLASREHVTEGPVGRQVRVLMRFRGPAARGSAQLSAADQSLEFLIAELLIRAQGGSLTLNGSEAEERVLVVELPAA